MRENLTRNNITFTLLKSEQDGFIDNFFICTLRAKTTRIDLGQTTKICSLIFISVFSRKYAEGQNVVFYVPEPDIPWIRVALVHRRLVEIELLNWVTVWSVCRKKCKSKTYTVNSQCFKCKTIPSATLIFCEKVVWWKTPILGGGGM